VDVNGEEAGDGADECDAIAMLDVMPMMTKKK
jgi:hypothetical protein